ASLFIHHSLYITIPALAHQQTASSKLLIKRSSPSLAATGFYDNYINFNFLTFLTASCTLHTFSLLAMSVIQPINMPVAPPAASLIETVKCFSLQLFRKCRFILATTGWILRRLAE